MRSRVASPLALAALGAFALSQTALSAPPGAERLAPAAARMAPASFSPARESFRQHPPNARRLRGLRPRKPLTYPVAKVVGVLRLRLRPRGPVRMRMRSSTEFGSPRVLGVAARRGRWLGVVTTERPNGKLAWVRRDDPGLRTRRIPYSIRADLSSRTLTLRRGRRTIKRLKVAIGRPGSPTPTGRFGVTDKLSGYRFGSYYGCCILALSGKQPNPPPGWRGGNRLAIHGTSSPGSIVQAASAGCLRAADVGLRLLMRRVPLGTPVVIHR